MLSRLIKHMHQLNTCSTLNFLRKSYMDCQCKAHSNYSEKHLIHEKKYISSSKKHNIMVDINLRPMVIVLIRSYRRAIVGGTPEFPGQLITLLLDILLQHFFYILLSQTFPSFNLVRRRN